MKNKKTVTILKIFNMTSIGLVGIALIKSIDIFFENWNRVLSYEQWAELNKGPILILMLALWFEAWGKPDDAI